VQKSITYKQVRWTSEGRDLQSLLQRAIRKLPAALDRHRPVDEQESAFHALNHHRSQDGALFSEVVQYTQGQHQQMLVKAPNAPEYGLEEYPPPENSDGHEREFLGSQLFFVVDHNHVALVQSQALSSRHLERYLRWLLAERLDLLEQEERFFLADQVAPKEKERITRSHAKKIRLGADLVTRAELPQSEARELVQHIPYGRGAELLRAAFGDRWKAMAHFSDALDEANIEVALEIRYKYRTTPNAQEFLDQVAISLRHAEPEDVEVELSDGGKIKGNDLRLSAKLRVEANNGRVDRQQLCEQMTDWLRQQIDRGVR